ncbi:MAG: DUF3160 domain-containing protein [Thermoguttaceae bacterium]|nr:DUF3160 domain-containing protein [Thermoguttaceae bacterium]MDW8036722.1 DUF3160 domain-containing protein [Thermoguttaceae bacterium]
MEDCLHPFLDTLLQKLLAISQKELSHQELTQEEYDFIRNVSQQLQRIEVQDPELAKLYQQAAAQPAPSNSKRSWKRLTSAADAPPWKPP